MTALLLLRTYWREGLITGLLVALALTVALYTASGHRKDAATAKAIAERDTANMKLSVSNGSIARLQAALADKNRETEARAASYAVTKVADREDVAAADKALAADNGRSAALEAIRKAAGPTPGCKVPPALVANLEGL